MSVRGLLAWILFAPLAGCGSLPSPRAPLATDAAGIEAEGPFVRHVRLRVAPAETKTFEAILGDAAELAERAGLGPAYDWLCYRESPGRYWVVTMADERADFPVPASDRPVRSLLGAVERAGGKSEGLPERFEAIEHELEWSLLTRQKAVWSTVDSMSTATHPKARIMWRTVRGGRATEFDRALAARTAFLAERGYPLPIEGFVVLEGLPREVARGAAMQVVFPRDWASFHASESFWEFVQALPAAGREAYLERKAALMSSMAGAEYFDGDFLPEASRQGR